MLCLNSLVPSEMINTVKKKIRVTYNILKCHQCIYRLNLGYLNAEVSYEVFHGEQNG